MFFFGKKYWVFRRFYFLPHQLNLNIQLSNEFERGTVGNFSLFFHPKHQPLGYYSPFECFVLSFLFRSLWGADNTRLPNWPSKRFWNGQFVNKNDLSLWLGCVCLPFSVFANCIAVYQIRCSQIGNLIAESSCECCFVSQLTAHTMALSKHKLRFDPCERLQAMNDNRRTKLTHFATSPNSGSHTLQKRLLSFSLLWIPDTEWMKLSKWNIGLSITR